MSYQFNKVLLKFVNKNVDKAFEAFSFNYDIQAFRVMSIAAIIANLILLPVDISRISDVNGAMFFRFGVTIQTFAFYLLSFWFVKRFQTYTQAFIFCAVIFFVAAYFIGLSIVQYPDYTFPNSVISILFFTLAISGLRFRYSMIYLLLIVPSYIIFSGWIVKNEYWASQSVAILVNAMLGVGISYLIERARRNFFIKNQIVIEQNEALEAADALKNKLFSILSHDLRGPVKKVITLVDLLKNDHISALDFRVHAEKVQEEMKRTVSFMENILYWSKGLMHGFQSNSSQIDIKEVLERNILSFSEELSKKEINIINGASVPFLLNTDEEMLNISIRNLLSNAIKFTPHGGQIDLGYVQDDGFVEIFVKDNGIGIEHEKQKDLFSIKNVSSKGTDGETGTGLGLFLVKEFTGKIGGTITFESEPGSGSIFKIRLPITG